MEGRYEEMPGEPTVASLSSDLDTDEEQFMMNSLTTQLRRTTIEDKEGLEKGEDENSHAYEVVLKDYQRTPSPYASGWLQSNSQSCHRW